MATPLLTTKLFIPPARPEWVRRSRLIEQLNAGLYRKLTLISAPAGFGKTTLLGDWARSCGRPVAWLSLDQADNDPTRFLAYLIAAFQSAEALQVAALNMGSTLDVPTTPQPASAEIVLTTLINHLGALPESLVLVLDDYHLISAQPIHDAVAFLLDHLPDNLHLTIASRADPPLPVARLRGRGQLTELRQSDLRFTLEEVTDFLNQAMALELSADNVAALTSRTEGWIAGLQMAAISMQGQRQTQAAVDLGRFVKAFTGSHRYILDYLVEEVLSQQSAVTQDFLIKTSILERLTGPLCDAVCFGFTDTESRPAESAVTGQDDGQTMLEQLDAANLFLIPLDDERRWYRYHRLFADLLRQRLYQAEPEQVPELHRRASDWYEANGLVAQAIEHALLTVDFERAARLIDEIAEATLMRSEITTFMRWVEALPDALVCTRPSLCVFYAWTLLLSGRSAEDVESWLRRVDEDTDLMDGRVAALLAFVALYQIQLPRATELAHQALKQLPQDELFLRSVATWILGLTRLADSDSRHRRQVLDEVVRMSQESGNVMIAVPAACQMARLRMRQGRLHEAKAGYERALALAVDRHGQPLPIASEPLLGLGELSREWDELEAAMQYLTQAIELTKRWSEAAGFDGYLALARVKQAQGDVKSARDALETASQLALRSESTELDDLVAALEQARLWVQQGQLGAAMRWIEERGLDPAARPLIPEESEDTLSHHLRKYEYLVLARLLLAQDQPHEALVLLEPLLPSMEQQERIDLTIEIQILRALAFQAADDGVQAMDALQHALSLAEPGGYVRIFVDEGRPMARLLHQAASQGIAWEYVTRLHAAFEVSEVGDIKAGPPLRHTQPLPDPLTERELQVLRLLAAGLSNPEIADELIIATSTVRTHVKNIYSKLAVHKRWDAVQRGQELGLL